MKQLYYSLRTLMRGRGSNIIKVVSLALALFVGILLFARIALELNFNQSFQDSERLYEIAADYNMGTRQIQGARTMFSPVPPTMLEEFPGQIAYATVYRDYGERDFFVGNGRYLAPCVFADSLFFQTLGMNLLSGNVQDMSVIDAVFISDEFASRCFQGENPVGKSIMYDKRIELIVKGTYRKIPVNNSIRPDVVITMNTLFRGGEGPGWGRSDSFQGFVRLKPDADPEVISHGMKAVVEKHMPGLAEKGIEIKHYLVSANQAHRDNPGVKRLVMIMSILGFSLLLIAALNYVLIVISSLSGRARGVGIHKCNGATSSQIMGMFLYETAIIIGISLLVILVLILNFREWIEDLLGVSISTLFSWNTMWVPVSVVLFIFLIAGVVPGRIFSKISVTHIFIRYANRNAAWKRILLFVQFAGLTFIFGILYVVLSQYHQMMNYSLGYDTRNVAYASAQFENKDVAKRTLQGLPMVEDVTLSMVGLGTFHSGDMVRNPEGKTLFSTRFNFVDLNFVPMMGMKIMEGRNLLGQNEALVNEEFARLMNWTDGALGKHYSSGIADHAVVVGVLKDFIVKDLFEEMQPVIFLHDPNWFGTYTLKLKEPFHESLIALNREVEQLYPTMNITFKSLEKHLEDEYTDIRRFRDSILIAFIAILFIALMGVIGYINDEIQRRSKEIAIRKVNGAEAGSILHLLSKEALWLALPAVAMGAIASYYISAIWLEQFGGTRLDLNLPAYVLLCIAIVLIILACIVSRAWQIANENPVKSIKSE